MTRPHAGGDAASTEIEDTLQPGRQRRLEVHDGKTARYVVAIPTKWPQR